MKIFENNKELTVIEIIKASGFKRITETEMRNRLRNLCYCGDEGEFDLLPPDDEAVLSGGKRYMQCRKCGLWSHL